MKFLIIDDHAMVREGVGAVLRQALPAALVVQAQDSVAAMAMVRDQPDIDLVFLDLMMPGTDGMVLLAEFGRAHPGIPVMVLSSSESPADVRRALALGALGYVPKSASPETLLAALKLVLAGEIYVPPFVLDLGTNASRPQAGNHSATLTARQIEVLKLICGAIANKEIAWRLSLSEKTVKAHVTAIFRTMHVSNRRQAARAARDAGLV